MEAKEDLSIEEVNKMEDHRIAMLQEAGIDEKEVLEQAREGENIWGSYFNENIVRGKDDMNFACRDQWTAIERSEFTRLFKPAMTANKVYEPLRKVAGEQRNNRPDLMVRSLTGRASQEQIDLRADLVRTIAYQEETDLVYQHAFMSALLMGFGAFSIDLDYESPTSFNQVARYILGKDPTLYSFDPKAMKPHKGDGDWSSVKYILSKQEFYARYPYIQDALSYTDSVAQLDFTWETRDSILLSKRSIKEWHSTLVYRLSNGMEVTRETWEKMQKQIEMQKKIAQSSQIVGDIILKDLPHIVRERQSQDYKIRTYLLIRDRIIDFSDWPSKHLPDIFVDGDSQYIEGRQYTRSFIRDTRDMQKLLNYIRSETAAEIKNRRREQWIGTPDNIVGYEQMWRNPELQNGILLAKADPKTGQMPTKMPAWELSPMLLQMAQAVTMDIREIMGYSEANMQPASRDISGIAKRERQVEMSNSVAIYSSNLEQAIQQGGRVVLDLLPIIAGNEERHMIVSKSDGKSQSVIFNKQMPDGSVKNVLEPGEYDIEIDTGPSFAIQKELALEFFQQTLAAQPQAFPLIADLWAKNLDVQFMPQIAERFKTMVPPEILAKEAGQPPPPPKPDPQAQMAEMSMKLQAAALQDRAHELQIRQEKHELEKVKLMMDAEKLQQEAALSKADLGVITHKSELDYTAKIAKIIADLHHQIKKEAT